MTAKFKKSAIFMALVLLTSLLLAACSDSTATPAKSGEAATKVPVETLSLALDWVPNTNHTGIYVALAKGWYAEEGIDLKILPYSEAATPESLIASGKAELGIGAAEGIVSAAAAGQSLVSIAAIIQKDTSALVTLKNSGLTSPKMLVGKKYAGFGASYEEPVINSMIKFDGGNGTFENITANVFGYEAVLNKQADFVWIFEGWDEIEAKLRGIDLNVIPITKYGVPDRYTPLIETSADVISKKSDALKRFMKATVRGYEYSITNPKDAADLLINSNPAGTFSNKELVYKSQDYLSPKYKEGATQWGSQTLKMWTDYPRFMFQAGILKDADNKPLTKELDYNKLFSNEFLPKN
ncbi:MAG: ABC transporter substrate-binding protein [Chloroflexi bacterium]|uniref:Thiamine pyrimidine synthase n=1 Tax=Candidatus Chlorohelix allophototropha TaxID=3003348 RepID=A0A8T7M281_9CHLR|nr:ABC transporter substrate-binding protein [Chloroflexota bacterium]WJW65711.1 ABC transporter substrate-binding protein [Chloroflexota bacterium L227-S17]